MQVLFVCLGNICRSPTAEAVFRQQLSAAGLDGQVVVDSAGTSDWHLNKAPDTRTRLAAQRRGYDMSALRGRQVCAEDFARFDLILAMDGNNLAELQALQPAGARAQQLAQPAAKVGKHRQANCAHQQVDNNGERAPLAAQQPQRAQNRKGLQGKGHGGGDGDPGTDGDQHRKQGNKHHIHGR